MTLVVHWGDGEKSFYDGFQWEVHSRDKTLRLVNNVGQVCGPVTVKNTFDPTDTSTVYHVWTDATGWVE